jgi:predicted Fe-Mo cluster-binding NifX family protein
MTRTTEGDMTTDRRPQGEQAAERGVMTVAVAMAPDGTAGQGWGRADRVAIARVEGERIQSWDEYDVGWDALHDEGSEGGHHARIARFLGDHAVQLVLAGHMGSPMVQMLGRMGIRVRLGDAGDPRAAVIAAVRTDFPDES